MRASRQTLQRLNVARTVAVTTLLVATVVIEVLFEPERSLGALYVLSGGVYAAVLLYAAVDRWIGGRKAMAVLQVAGDTLLIFGFLFATGGGLSPLSFLLVIPVMLAAALMGLRGGVLAAAGIGGAFALLLAYDSWYLPASELSPGRVLYAAVSHLVAFVTVGALGGVLADRLKQQGEELEERREDLRALKALHADIVASIGTGLMTTDGEGRVTFVNRAGRGLLRRGEEAVVGRAAAEIFGLPSDVLSQASGYLEEGRRYRFEREWTRPESGERLLLGFSVSYLRGRSGEPVGWLVVFQDLTEIAFLEQQVRTKERMAALGEMAAGIAHELRNPLAAICGSVQVLSRGGSGGEAGHRLEQVVLREADRLNRIIKDFLKFARPGAHSPRECDLLEVMEQMARLLGKSPDVSPVHRCEVTRGPGRTVAIVDPDSMRQVFWNLASNALKAMPDGGTLSIEVAGHGGDEVMVTFRDEGHGMDEEAMRVYFQPFKSRFQGGTGLGAAIVYRIVEEQGGRVQVVSHPGRGTEIRLILPGKPGAAGGVSAASRTAMVGAE